jgi:tetratricopeptide (TPR) repeat protein
MSTISRREKIEAMLAQEPRDTMLRYMLAMELDKEGQHTLSLEYLSGLMQDQPPHVPSFFRSAQQLQRLGRIEEARSILRVGIEEARRQRDLHAAGEMGELLANLGDVAF